ncbi:MAG: hydroxyacid dehydrogenase [Thermoanaerobacteraceae bacterium]|nr:hydroxyacid dehydrogenase [Thermoanaerobacteraceae bacterium]
MRYRVLIPEKIAEEGIDYLREIGYEVKMGRGIDKQVLIQDLQDCDAVIVRMAVLDEEVMKGCMRLKVIAKHGVGVDNIDLDAARKYNKRVVYTPCANIVSVAEHTMTLILACAKNINFMSQEYKNGNYWIKDVALTSEVRGKILGIIGLGRIGLTVAKMAKYGFGMNIIAYDPFIQKDKQIDEVTLVKTWDEVFKNADFITIHMPLTKETEKSIGKKEFEMMKDTAYFINTSRGKIVDEEALVEALKKKKIGGAGLDVTNPEPADINNPLFRMDNVILTPHCAGSTKEAMIRMAMDAIKGIQEVLSDKEPTYCIV